MSGYLQRLVDRAQGTPPTLRPSLPSRSMGPAASAVDELSFKNALPGSADDPQPGRLLGRRDSLPGADDPARRPPPSTPATAPARGERGNDPDPLLQQRPEAINPLVPPVPAQQKRGVEVRQGSATSVDHPPSAPGSDALPERLLPRPARAAEEERLTPVAPQPHHNPPAHLSLLDNSTAQREVHVSIGRIEVTALPQAMAPPPKTRERSEGLSLEAYLARRRGGER